MKRVLPLLILLLSCSSLIVTAQKETEDWFLHSGNQMDFSSGEPVAGSSSLPNGIGSTSVNDNNGNLLFTSNGDKVFNRNGQVMPALVSASLGATRPVLLSAPVPGSPGLHYLFYGVAPPVNGAAIAIKYALIDMNMAGGLGDLLSYNTVVDSGFGNYFTLIARSGTPDFWVVSHKNNTDSFYSRLVTAAGIAATPVLSRAGQGLDKTQNLYLDMRPSHDGKLLGVFSQVLFPGIFASSISFVEVFHFNPTTGAITPKIKSVNTTGYYSGLSQLEFSPDNRLLYVSETAVVPNLQPCGFASSAIAQYNLCYTDSNTFTYNKAIVGTSFTFCSYVYHGRLQMGPDKKIYFPFTPSSNMRRLEHPNRIGTSARMNTAAVGFSGSLAYTTPSFYHHYIEKAVKNNIIYTTACYPNAWGFSVSNDAIGAVSWDFGDPASGSANHSTLLQPQHSFSAPGFYTITAQLYSSNGQLIETITEQVEVKNPAQRLLAGLPADTSMCQGSGLNIKLSALNAIFLWKWKSNGQVFDYQVGDSIRLDLTGTWYVEMRQGDCNGCILRDSITVNILPQPTSGLGPDRNLCTGDSLRLNVFYPDATYLWSTGATTPAITVTQAGTYAVQSELNNNGCYFRDTIVVNAIPGVVFSLPADTVLCNNQTLLLNPGVTNATYTWQDGSANTNFLVTQPGTYWVRMSNGACTRSDTIHVAYINTTAVTLGPDTSLCQGSFLDLQPNITGASYEWSTGAITPAITVQTAGQYWVKVRNAACTLADTIQVSFEPRPLVALGNDTAICQPQRLVLRATNTGTTYQWSNGSTADTLVTQASGSYWVRVKRNGCIVADTIQLEFKPQPTVNLGRDTVICLYQSLPLSAALPGATAYTWNTGAITSGIVVTTAGTYWAMVTAANGCSNRDSIAVGVKTLPGFTLGRDTTLCEGETYTLSTGLNNASMVWSTGSLAPEITVTTPGLYWVEATQNQCTQRDSISIAYNALPIVSLGNDTTLCESRTIVLDAGNPGATYQWSTGSTARYLLASKPGIYSVSVTRNRCVSRDTLSIAYTLRPRFLLGADGLICAGQSFTLQPVLSPDWQLRWQDGSSAPDFVVTQPGLYSLAATNECGTTRDEVRYTPGLCKVYFPNAFTPNGDGKNDIFRAMGTEAVTDFYLQIYNRTGQLVFETRDKTAGWDGRVRGLPGDAGNYVYTCRYTELMASPVKLLKGSLLLVR